MRKPTKAVKVRDIQIGGGAPVVVQSMTKTDTTDVDATIRQIEEMVEAGCEVVRIAVPDDDAAAAMKEIRKRTNVPLVADIHFHYKLALKALEAGIDKLRINPGNIGNIDRVREVARAAWPSSRREQTPAPWRRPRPSERRRRGAGPPAVSSPESRCAR